MTRALGVRLGTLMDDDESPGPVYIDASQMEEAKRVWFIDEFPMTPSMKIQKFKLREMAEENVKRGL